MPFPLATPPTAASCADTVAIPTAENAAPASAAAANRLNCVVDCFMAISSARVHHDIDERGLPGLDHRDRALQCGPEIFRIGNGAFAVDAKAPCDRSVIDIRILDRGADLSVRYAAAMARGHGLQIH